MLEWIRNNRKLLAFSLLAVSTTAAAVTAFILAPPVALAVFLLPLVGSSIAAMGTVAAAFTVGALALGALLAVAIPLYLAYKGGKLFVNWLNSPNETPPDSSNDSSENSVAGESSVKKPQQEQKDQKLGDNYPKWTLTATTSPDNRNKGKEPIVNESIGDEADSKKVTTGFDLWAKKPAAPVDKDDKGKDKEPVVEYNTEGLTP